MKLVFPKSVMMAYTNAGMRMIKERDGFIYAFSMVMNSKSGKVGKYKVKSLYLRNVLQSLMYGIKLFFHFTSLKTL